MSADKNVTDILARIVELIRDDPILHDAVVSFIRAKADHERALTRAADARRRRR